MDLELFISFLVATIVIVTTPGPSVALASSQAVRFGPKGAIFTVLGDALGSAVHITIAVAGLQLLLSIASQILPVLQILGGGYIVYLAYESYFSSDQENSGRNISSGQWSTFIGGFLACVSNPKAIIFFAALFPGFIAPNYNLLTQSFVYGVIFIVLDALFILFYSFLAMKTFQSSIGRSFDVGRISGVGLLIIGLVLILKGYSDLI